MMDADYAVNITLLKMTQAQAESPLHSLEEVVGGVGLCVKAN